MSRVTEENGWCHPTGYWWLYRVWHNIHNQVSQFRRQFLTKAAGAQRHGKIKPIPKPGSQKLHDLFEGIATMIPRVISTIFLIPHGLRWRKPQKSHPLFHRWSLPYEARISNEAAYFHMGVISGGSSTDANTDTSRIIVQTMGTRELVVVLAHR